MKHARRLTCKIRCGLRGLGRFCRPPANLFVSWQAQTPPPLLPLAACHALHLTSPVDWLNDRLKRRFDIMIAQGALEEARSNLEFWDPKWQSSQAIGAPELIAHLEGQFSLDEAKTHAL